MTLFNTTLQAMQQNQQLLQSQPANNSALEEILANITKITPPQAEATKNAAEESRQSREEKSLSDTKFPRFGNKANKKVMAWYNSILSKLSTAAWSDLYNENANDIIAQTTYMHGQSAITSTQHYTSAYMEKH
eukprot:12593758-Ditylum_brightwellii.AAC.1